MKGMPIKPKAALFLRDLGVHIVNVGRNPVELCCETGPAKIYLRGGGAVMIAGPGQVFTKKQERAIRRAIKDGTTRYEMAKALGCKSKTIEKICYKSASFRKWALA